jgi:hypothetical protein
MAYLYCTATNTGSGFVTGLDREHFFLEGFIPGNVWVVGDNTHGSAWITQVSGTSKTKEEAQTLVDNAVSTAQAVWDAQSPIELTQADTTGLIRPEGETLP